MVIFEISCSLSLAQPTTWNRESHEKLVFFLFLSLQRARKVSKYTSAGLKSCQIPRSTSLQNIVAIAPEFERKSEKPSPHRTASFGTRLFMFLIEPRSDVKLTKIIQFIRGLKSLLCEPSFHTYALPCICDGLKTFSSNKKKAERFSKKRRRVWIQLLLLRCQVWVYGCRFAAYEL